MSYGRAVVIGSGIGGLVTARVLSDHFDDVILIDRDSIPDSPRSRKGIPQGNHFHAILPGGLRILNELFPDFYKDLEENGSLVPDPGQFYFYSTEGKSYNLMRFQPEPLAPPPDWPKTHVQTRGLLEHCVRKRVVRVPNITTRYDTLIRDVVVQNNKVIGIKVDESGEVLEADLVIDATGKASRTLGWLDQLGYKKPIESEVRCDFAYSSVFVKPKDPDVFTDVGFFLGNDPESEFPFRGGALVRMEDGSLLASIGGRLGDHPPRDFDGFREFTKTLLHPALSEIISDVEPITEPHHFKFPKSLRRHYEQLDSFPEGLLPIADAICHFNPLYGQGMSAASRTAVALGELIAARKAESESLDGLWQDYFQAAFEQTRAPWLFAALADFQNAGTEGDFPEEEQKTVETMMKLNKLAGEGNMIAAGALALVQTMQKPLSFLNEQEILDVLSLSEASQ
jgi:2-polyprenyl-6-methoxyphenol hydroxylase-like FAD-dependent oxidoreductase